MCQNKSKLLKNEKGSKVEQHGSKMVWQNTYLAKSPAKLKEVLSFLNQMKQIDKINNMSIKYPHNKRENIINQVKN